MIGGFAAAAAGLTGGFEHWTFEEGRVARAQRGQMHAPATPVRTSRGELAALFQPGAPRTVYLVDFIYTRCPGVCRALGSEYQQMQHALDAAAVTGVQLLSLSFDLAHDGTAELAAYATQHHARPSRWTVAVPATATDNRRLLEQLQVVAVADGWGGYLHNGDIHLITSDGRVAGVFAYDEWPAAWLAARRLAAEPP